MAEASPTKTSGKCRAVYLTGVSDINKLVVQDRDVPEITPKQCQIEIKACGINFKELMERMGIPGTAQGSSKTPYVMGFEAAGVITKIGSEVTRSDIQIGSKVCCLGNQLWSEIAVCDANALFPMPEEISFEESAALPVVYLTAYMMLFNQGNLHSGMTVLIHMVAGGVGTAAVQLCKTVDNVTIIGTCSGSKHEKMKAMGVDHLIDYRTQDYAPEVKRLYPNGIDLILDPLGGQDFAKGYELLSPLGHIISFGFANAVSGEKKSYIHMFKNWMQWKNLNTMQMMTHNKTVSGFHLGYLMDAKSIQKVLAAKDCIVKLYLEGKIKPIIDSVYGFDQIGDAIRRMHSRQNIGKVVIVPKLVGRDNSGDGADEGTLNVSTLINPEDVNENTDLSNETQEQSKI